MISTGQLLTLLVGAAVVASASLVACCSLVLVYMARRIHLADDLLARVMACESEVSALDKQVAKLRTSKAGTVSNRRRAEIADPAPPAPPQFEDPLLEGLTPEERALFSD